MVEMIYEGYRFNPTLVRLRRGGAGKRRGHLPKFQSHAGSIEAQRPPLLLILLEQVSIPRWFD